MPNAHAPCVICRGRPRLKFVTSQTKLSILECPTCGLWILDKRLLTPERHAIYTGRYFEGWGSSQDLAGPINCMKRKTFERVFREISGYRAPGRLLDVGCAFGASLQVAEAWGWDGYGLELNPSALALAREKLGSRIMCGDFESVELQEQSYDTILMFDVLEHLPDPVGAVAKVYRLLRPNGLVVINTPCPQSLSARLMRRIWFHVKTEHLFLFSRRSLLLLLEQSGFRCLAMRPSVKALNLLYIDHILRRYRVAWISLGVHLLALVAPPRLKQFNVSLWSGDMFVIAKKVRG